MSEYSIKKSKKILLNIYRGLKTKKAPLHNDSMIDILKKLQEAILADN